MCWSVLHERVCSEDEAYLRRIWGLEVFLLEVWLGNDAHNPFFKEFGGFFFGVPHVHFRMDIHDSASRVPGTKSMRTAAAAPVARRLSLQNCHSFWELGGFADCIHLTLLWAIFAPCKCVVSLFCFNKEFLKACPDPVVDFPVLNGQQVHC